MNTSSLPRLSLGPAIALGILALAIVVNSVMERRSAQIDLNAAVPDDREYVVCDVQPTFGFERELQVMPGNVCLASQPLTRAYTLDRVQGGDLVKIRTAVNSAGNERKYALPIYR